MTELYLKFHTVTFSYDSSVEQLFKDISFHIAKGWAGVVGANGTGKTTLLKLATRHLAPKNGVIDSPQHSIYCHQRTDEPPDQITDFFTANSKEANILKDKLQIGKDWRNRWDTLSHGERKRIQLGVALWLKPDLLAVDEPTNHLDTYARELILNTLSEHQGIGLLVSHDRELLDKLCATCIFTMPPTVIIRPGGVTKAGAALRQEQQAVQKQFDIAKSVLKKLQREAICRKQKAQQADRKRSKHHLAPKDHDAREKIDRARVSGKDAYTGKLYRQLRGRLTQQQHQLEKIKIEKKRPLGIWLPGSVLKRDYVLKLPAEVIQMGVKRKLFFPDLTVKPGDRIAITGPNGSGKSTFIKHLLGHLNTDIEHVTYIPQEIDTANSKEILDKVMTLQKNKLGHLMTVVSRLNSRPERLLFTNEPSPGEIRKLLLALGVTNEPYLIIMDEPTNHLDLPSIECLESALSDCPCALILASHDMYFLKRLTSINWRLSSQENGLNFNLEYKIMELGET